MTPYLKYLFIAEFADGSFLAQTQEDKPSWAMREDGSGSAFTDVLNPKSPLIRFTLCGDNREYGVDLLTLNFSIACGDNVSQFRLHEASQLPLKDVEIIYMRNVKQHKHIHFKNIQTNMEVDFEDHSTEISYRLGWKAKNLLGEEITKFIEFD